MSSPESASAFWDRRYQAASWLWTSEPNPLVAEFATGLPPGRAVDLGAGEGRNAVWLAKRGWRVTALDVSGVALARAAGRAAEAGVELDCIQADWREYRSDPSSFDLAVISFMHPKPDERAWMFGLAGEALVPGGHLFVVGVDLTEHGRRGPGDADRLYTRERLLGALPGFEVRRCESVTYEAQSGDGLRRVVDVVAVAQRAGRPVPDDVRLSRP